MSSDYSGNVVDHPPGASPQPAQSEGALFVRDSQSGSGLWYVQPTAPSNVPIWFTNGQALGTATDIPMQGDFDGDGKMDLATYNLTTAVWTVTSRPATDRPSSWGPPSRRPTRGACPWSATSTARASASSASSTSSAAGAVDPHHPDQGRPDRVLRAATTGDIPEPGDYDGVGYDQLAVYRPSTGQFLVLQDRRARSRPSPSRA